jgi:CDP-paratose 2-epimerase
MALVIITGSNGLIGNEAVRFFSDKGFDVVGIDNNFRKIFFGNDGDTSLVKENLIRNYSNYKHYDSDIRSSEEIIEIFKIYKNSISLVIHAAAQPSHDWAAKDPLLDFQVNTLGTLNLLEATRNFCPEATFIYMSTNKVYGDRSNSFEYIEGERRFNLSKDNIYKLKGFDENLSIDQSLHSLFGVNKLSADLLSQEYGRYFGLKTITLRGGCLSGPTHQGAELHGFLSYLVKCAFLNKEYKIYGYKGKQVRDNLHSYDVVKAFWEIYQNPKSGDVYNLGGGIDSNISILEAIDYLESKNYHLKYSVEPKNRMGDHRWWISDITKFKNDFPNWKVTKNAHEIIDETLEALISSNN